MQSGVLRALFADLRGGEESAPLGSRWRRLLTGGQARSGVAAAMALWGGDAHLSAAASLLSPPAAAGRRESGGTFPGRQPGRRPALPALLLRPRGLHPRQPGSSARQPAGLAAPGPQAGRAADPRGGLRGHGVDGCGWWVGGWVGWVVAPPCQPWPAHGLPTAIADARVRAPAPRHRPPPPAPAGNLRSLPLPQLVDWVAAADACQLHALRERCVVQLASRLAHRPSGQLLPVFAAAALAAERCDRGVLAHLLALLGAAVSAARRASQGEPPEAALPPTPAETALEALRRAAGEALPRAPTNIDDAIREALAAARVAGVDGASLEAEAEAEAAASGQAGSLEWALERFTEHFSAVGDRVCSPWLDAAGTRWRFVVYPGGHAEEAAGHLSGEGGARGSAGLPVNGVSSSSGAGRQGSLPRIGAPRPARSPCTPTDAAAPPAVYLECARPGTRARWALALVDQAWQRPRNIICGSAHPSDFDAGWAAPPGSPRLASSWGCARLASHAELRARPGYLAGDRLLLRARVEVVP